MKFSIVTPSFNSGKFIAETIESVISQKGDFEIEYIIVDGGSEDDTVDIIKKYERLINGQSPIVKCRKIHFKWTSARDRGMYDAINKGFKSASGDIFAWINSNDIYLPGAFDTVQKVFDGYPDVRWLKGITSYINENSMILQIGRCYIYDRSWIKMGVYGREAYFIQQDSVFWRSELWRRVGQIDASLRLAGDFYLWTRFAEMASLYTVKAYVSCFRRHEGQYSLDLKAYLGECDGFHAYPGIFRRKIRYFFNIEERLPRLLRPFFYRLFFGKQEFYLIEQSGGNFVLKKNDYYLG